MAQCLLFLSAKNLLSRLALASRWLPQWTRRCSSCCSPCWCALCSPLCVHACIDEAEPLERASPTCRPRCSRRSCSASSRSAPSSSCAAGRRSARVAKLTPRHHQHNKHELHRSNSKCTCTNSSSGRNGRLWRRSLSRRSSLRTSRKIGTSNGVRRVKSLHSKTHPSLIRAA